MVHASFFLQECDRKRAQNEQERREQDNARRQREARPKRNPKVFMDIEIEGNTTHVEVGIATCEIKCLETPA